MAATSLRTARKGYPSIPKCAVRNAVHELGLADRLVGLAALGAVEGIARRTPARAHSVGRGGRSVADAGDLHRDKLPFTVGPMDHLGHVQVRDFPFAIAAQAQGLGSCHYGDIVTKEADQGPAGVREPG